jgi:hypothetical protein
MAGQRSEGIFTSVNGYTYNGSWLNDKQHGYGLETYASGESYEGSFHEG